jgi:hypothetical protein
MKKKLKQSRMLPRIYSVDSIAWLYIYHICEDDEFHCNMYTAWADMRCHLFCSPHFKLLDLVDLSIRWVVNKCLAPFLVKCTYSARAVTSCNAVFQLPLLLIVLSNFSRNALRVFSRVGMLCEAVFNSHTSWMSKSDLSKIVR